MYSTNILSVLFCALVSSAAAMPLSHGHSSHLDHRMLHHIRNLQPQLRDVPKVRSRRSCRHNASSVAVTSTEAPAPSVTTAPKSNNKVTGNDGAESSSKSPTSSVASASTKASAFTKASASPSPSPSASPKSSSDLIGSLLDMLFPVSQGSDSWTTSTDAKDALPLSDATIKPAKEIKSLGHKYVTSPGPDAKKAIQATYPKGSYTYDHQPQGGLSFYGPGAVDLTQAKEATFGYSVMFSEGFEWNKGGKLPGLYGGDSDEEAVSCSGGRRDPKCFSARLMWRADGAGELYTYLPDYEDAQFAVNEKQCSVAPQSECNPEYGSSVGRGSFHFAAGVWNTVSQRVRLNDAGQANGELELFFNGNSVVNVNGLILRPDGQGRIRGIQMQTFFGGHSDDYASPKDQDTWFTDFSVAVTEKL